MSNKLNTVVSTPVWPAPEQCLEYPLAQRSAWLQTHCLQAGIPTLTLPKGLWVSWLSYKLGFSVDVALYNGYSSKLLFVLWCYSLYPWPWQHQQRLACRSKGCLFLTPTASLGQWAYAYFMMYHWQRHPNSLGDRFLLKQFLKQHPRETQIDPSASYSNHEELGLLNALRCEEEALAFVHAVCDSYTHETVRKRVCEEE